MKLLVLFACSVLIGCGVIFGLVHCTVPHLVAPEFFPKASAREREPEAVESAIAGAGRAVRAGTAQPRVELVADGR